MTDQELIDGNTLSPLERLRAIMHRLRAPGGCSWDAEQTHSSLISNLIEEAYETIDAIQRGHISDLQEELGDLLLQVYFHSEIASESNHFDLDMVADGISEKLIRRHPHVFAGAVADDPDAVLKQWDEIKRAEKGDQKMNYLHGTGKGLPALMRGVKLQKKAAKVGFDWGDPLEIIEKIKEELFEVESAMLEDNSPAIEEEIGDLLFSVVNLARYRKIDPEVLMANANQKFENRFTKMEEILSNEGLTLDEVPLSKMESTWLEAKKAQKST